MSRKIGSMLVALSLVLVGGSVALTQAKGKPPMGSAGIDVPKCPQGWHVRPGSQADGGKRFTCEPNKPTEKIKCAPKFEYWETECAFGCKVTVH